MGKRNPAQVTLKDIAQKTGYTINTVSHALKNKPDISAATRLRIQQVADEMGYVGNALAESMRTGYTRTIALILGDIANPHLALIACEAERTTRAAGYNTILYNTEENPDLELHAIRSAVAQKPTVSSFAPRSRITATFNTSSSAGFRLCSSAGAFRTKRFPARCWTMSRAGCWPRGICSKTATGGFCCWKVRRISRAHNAVVAATSARWPSTTLRRIRN